MIYLLTGQKQKQVRNLSPGGIIFFPREAELIPPLNLRNYVTGFPLESVDKRG